MVFQEPGRPGGLLGQLGELLHRCPERRRLPGEVEEDEVVGQVQLVPGVDVLHQPAEIQQVDLAHDDPVLVLVDDGADLAQARMDRRPVLVMANTGLVAAKFRVLGEPVDGVDPEAVDAAVEPEAEDSCIAASTSGLSQLRSGCCGANEWR